ncbi:hypothetical protein [uncultured Mediterranean phage]|nr:hypothetical protein [uncultured Mediterranean phage]
MNTASIKDTVLRQCLAILKREDVKTELKHLMRPMIDLILQEIYPYIFLSMIFVFISFLLILGIFILLMRYKINTTIKS